MATLTITIDPGTGPVSKTMTFSAADATRIMNAYKAQQPGATVTQLAGFLATRIKRDILQLVIGFETTVPTPPVIT